MSLFHDDILFFKLLMTEDVKDSDHNLKNVKIFVKALKTFYQYYIKNNKDWNIYHDKWLEILTSIGD